jgi:hypothetical protein
VPLLVILLLGGGCENPLVQDILRAGVELAFKQADGSFAPDPLCGLKLVGINNKNFLEEYGKDD